MSNQDFYNFYKKHNRGQAAIELAIFGSLILLVLGVFVRYGLSANYSQKLKMDVYTKARAEMWGDAQKTTYIMLRDKPIPNPSDPFGVASRDSVFFGSETVGRMQGVFDTPDYPSEENLLTSPQLPRLIYDINGTIYKFTTGAFAYYEHDNQELKRKNYRDDGAWYWKTSGPSRTEDGEVYEHDDEMEPDGDFWAGLAEEDVRGERADVDGDGKEELVLSAGLIQVGSHTESVTEYMRLCEGDVYWDPDLDPDGNCYWDFVTMEVEVFDYEADVFYVLDYQEGQIDADHKGPDGQKQGLQSLSRKNLELIDCSIRREENNSGIKSTTRANWKQDITRYIIVNPSYVVKANLTVGAEILPGLALSYEDIDGDGQPDWYVNIESDFSENKTLQWSAAHAN